MNLHCAPREELRLLRVLYPVEGFAFGLAEPLPIEIGVARPSDTAGLGVELDWAEIDRCTVAIV